jgi:hypothetical protein
MRIGIKNKVNLGIREYCRNAAAPKTARIGINSNNNWILLILNIVRSPITNPINPVNNAMTVWPTVVDNID